MTPTPDRVAEKTAVVAKPTPGPWSEGDFEGHVVAANNRLVAGCMGHQDGKEGTRLVNLANARLIAAAPDHALFARAMVSGVVRWECFTGSTTDGEICCNGLRYSSELDEFGVPRLREIHRVAIAKAESLS